MESPDPIRYDIEYPNNSDYVKTWEFIDSLTGDSVLAATDTFRLDVKETRDIAATAVISALTTSNPLISGIISDAAIATNGKVQVTLRRDDLQDGLGDGGIARKRLFFDFQRKSVDGIVQTFVQGELILTMGITDQ